LLATLLEGIFRAGDFAAILYHVESQGACRDCTDAFFHITVAFAGIVFRIAIQTFFATAIVGVFAFLSFIAHIFLAFEDTSPTLLFRLIADKIFGTDTIVKSLFQASNLRAFVALRYIYIGAVCVVDAFLANHAIAHDKLLKTRARRYLTVVRQVIV